MSYIIASDHTDTTWGPFVTPEAARAWLVKLGGDPHCGPYWIIRASDEHEQNPRIYNYST